MAPQVHQRWCQLLWQLEEPHVVARALGVCDPLFLSAVQANIDLMASEANVADNIRKPGFVCEIIA